VLKIVSSRCLPLVTPAKILVEMVSRTAAKTANVAPTANAPLMEKTVAAPTLEKQKATNKHNEFLSF
jgi:hypothetical protein